MSEEVQTPDTPAVEQTQTQPVAETTTSSWVNEDGTWNAEAFGDLKEHSAVQKYKTPAETMKALINKDHVIGKKVEDFWLSDDPEISAKRNELMGVPADASGYDFKVEIPENVPVSDERIQAFKEYAKEIGLSKDKAEALLKFDIQSAQSVIEQREQDYVAKMEESTQSLKTEWKNDYDYNVSKVSDTLDHLGLGEFKDHPEYGNNPEFIKAVFDKIVPLIDNDEIIEARQTQSLSTIEDRLRLLDDEIWAFPADELNSEKYKLKINERKQLLEKIA